MRLNPDSTEAVDTAGSIEDEALNVCIGERTQYHGLDAEEHVSQYRP